METDISDLSAITRTITYVADPQKVGEDQGVYDTYFETATPSGAQLASPTSTSWELTFTGDTDAIDEATDQALDTTGSTLSIESSPNQSDPASIIATVIDKTSCSTICSPSNSVGLVDTITAKGGYSPATASVDVTSGEPATFILTPPIVSVTSEFAFDLFGSASATTSFVVDNAMVAVVGDGFVKLFTPASDSGKLTVEKGDKQTTFTVRFSGDDATALSAKYGKWAQGSDVGIRADSSSNFFWAASTYVVSPSLTSIVLGHEVKKNTTVVHLPFGQTTSSGGTFTYSGGGPTPSFQSSGPTLAGLVLIGVLLLLLAAAVLVLVRFRAQAKRILDRASARTRASIAQKVDTASPLFGIPFGPLYVGSFGTLLSATHVGASRRPLTLLSIAKVPAPPGSKTRASMLTVNYTRAPRVVNPSLFNITNAPASAVPAPTSTQGI